MKRQTILIGMLSVLLCVFAIVSVRNEYAAPIQGQVNNNRSDCVYTKNVVQRGTMMGPGGVVVPIMGLEDCPPEYPIDAGGVCYAQSGKQCSMGFEGFGGVLGKCMMGACMPDMSNECPMPDKPEVCGLDSTNNTLCCNRNECRNEVDEQGRSVNFCCPDIYMQGTICPEKTLYAGAYESCAFFPCRKIGMCSPFGYSRQCARCSLILDPSVQMSAEERAACECDENDDDSICFPMNGKRYRTLDMRCNQGFGSTEDSVCVPMRGANTAGDGGSITGMMGGDTGGDTSGNMTGNTAGGPGGGDGGGPGGQTTGTTAGTTAGGGSSTSTDPCATSSGTSTASGQSSASSVSSGTQSSGANSSPCGSAGSTGSTGSNTSTNSTQSQASSSDTSSKKSSSTASSKGSSQGNSTGQSSAASNNSNRSVTNSVGNSNGSVTNSVNNSNRSTSNSVSNSNQSVSNSASKSNGSASNSASNSQSNSSRSASTNSSQSNSSRFSSQSNNSVSTSTPTSSQSSKIPSYCCVSGKCYEGNNCTFTLNKCESVCGVVSSSSSSLRTSSSKSSSSSTSSKSSSSSSTSSKSSSSSTSSKSSSSQSSTSSSSGPSCDPLGCQKGGQAFCNSKNQPICTVPSVYNLICIECSGGSSVSSFEYSSDPFTSSTSSACTSNLDCAESAFCMNEVCVDRCTEGVDCPPDYPNVVTKLPPDAPVCFTDQDCVVGQRCILHSCLTATDLAVLPTFCGNGRLDVGEACDNGVDNTNAPNAVCRPDCTFGRCGDGILDTPLEQCDDGNVMNVDGCSAACFPERTAPTATLPAQIIELPFTATMQSSSEAQVSSEAPTILSPDGLITKSPVPSTPDSGPAALAVMLAGAAAGWLYRKRT